MSVSNVQFCLPLIGSLIFNLLTIQRTTVERTKQLFFVVMKCPNFGALWFETVSVCKTSSVGKMSEKKSCHKRFAAKNTSKTWLAFKSCKV